MLAEHGNISVGIDLGRDYSQIAFCSKSDRAPLMVMQSEEEKEENDYLIRTPVDLFSLVERKDARGVEVIRKGNERNQRGIIVDNNTSVLHC